MNHRDQAGVGLRLDPEGDRFVVTKPAVTENGRADWGTSGPHAPPARGLPLLIDRTLMLEHRV